MSRGDIFARRGPSNRGRGAGALTGPPAIFSLAQGLVFWADSDFVGGVADGSTAPALINRATGSGANIAITAGGAGQVTYRASAWAGQSCLHFVDKGIRTTDPATVAAAVGTGKTFTRIRGCVPRMTATSAPGTSLYGGGWDTAASGFPAGACAFLLTKNDRFTWSAYAGGSETAVDTALINQNAQIVEFMRDTATTCRFGVNKTRTAQVPYGSGVNFTPDGYTIGAWSAAGTAFSQCDMFLRFDLVWNRALTDAERDVVYAYLTSAYRGFENIASLGATSAETLVFPGIGQSVEVGSQDLTILNTYAETVGDTWLQGLNGLTRLFSENAYDSTLQATGAINHAAPDVAGQCSYGAMAAQLRALGITSRIIFVPCAVGSTSATQWNTGHADAPATYQNIYGAFRKALTEAMRAPGAILGGILINQGEADAQVDAPTATAWGPKWDTICTDILALAVAQGWSWKKAKRFFFTRLQLASSLGFRNELWAAQDLLCGTTRADCVLTQMPDASPPALHPQAPKQIIHGTNRGNAYFAAT